MYEIETADKPERNYQLDFLKLFLAMIVFLSHTTVFVGENTKRVTVSWLGCLGWVSVFCFFVISGMLMANSFDKTESKLNPAKQAWNYVTKKFINLSAKYWTALLIGTIVLIISYIYLGNPKMILQLLSQIMPEVFCLNLCGIFNIEVNSAAWYISAMLICMLPLSYLLAKNKNLYFYVIAPSLALITYGWMFNQDNPFVGRTKFYGIFTGGVILGFCGLSFGAVAYLISKYIYIYNLKPYSKLITAIEVSCYFVFGFVWFSSDLSKAKYVFPAFLFFVLAVAMTFSGKSYVGKLFKFKWLKFAAPASITLYLNHIAARKIVLTFFPGESYKTSCLLMAAFTVAVIAVFIILLRVWGLLKKKFHEKQTVKTTN